MFKANLKIFGMGLLVLTLILSFQNCAKKLGGSSSTSVSSGSSLLSLNLEDVPIGVPFEGSESSGLPLVKISNNEVCQLADRALANGLQADPEIFNLLKESIPLMEAPLKNCPIRFGVRRPPVECATTPSIGTQCIGGSIYAGSYDGDEYLITPSGCDSSKTPNCSGDPDTLIVKWSGLNQAPFDIPGVENNNINESQLPSSKNFRGDVNTAAMLAHPSVGADSAAVFCSNLDFGGYQDWYLPSKSELAYIYCKSAAPNHNPLFPREDPNCALAGGKSTQLGGFNTEFHYWSSAEVDPSLSRILSFDTGLWLPQRKDGNAFVRCVRRM